MLRLLIPQMPTVTAACCHMVAAQSLCDDLQNGSFTYLVCLSQQCYCYEMKSCYSSVEQKFLFARKTWNVPENPEHTSLERWDNVPTP